MTKEIDVLVVEPGKAPYPAKVKNTMDAFKKIVGGPLEIGSYLPKRVLLICNGEGKDMGLPPNRPDPCGGDYIAGTFLLCSFEGADFISLTPTQQTEFQAHFVEPGEFRQTVSTAVCANRSGAAIAIANLRESQKETETVVLTKLVGRKKTPVA